MGSPEALAYSLLSRLHDIVHIDRSGCSLKHCLHELTLADNPFSAIILFPSMIVSYFGLWVRAGPPGTSTAFKILVTPL